MEAERGGESGMKPLWCWRCQMDVPMLDEDEYARVAALYSRCLSEGQVAARMQPVLDAYEEITGFRETNANAVMHHRLSLYGLSCVGCGKPLRTPRASFCAACGRAV